MAPRAEEWPEKWPARAPVRAHDAGARPHAHSSAHARADARADARPHARARGGAEIVSEHRPDRFQGLYPRAWRKDVADAQTAGFEGNTRSRTAPNDPGLERGW